jgi:hypothetical protein
MTTDLEEDQRSKSMAERFLALKGQLRDETDRGAVIVAAALLEDALESMLLARLVPSPERDDELFHGPYAPLSTFSAKIDFAYRVGLIRLSVRSSLHLLRRIRNEFAHSATTGSFESQSVVSRLRELFKLNKDIFEALHEDIRSEPSEVSEILERAEGKDGVGKLTGLIGQRAVFDLLVSLTAAALTDLPNDISPLQQVWEDGGEKTDGKSA